MENGPEGSNADGDQPVGEASATREHHPSGGHLSSADGQCKDDESRRNPSSKPNPHQDQPNPHRDDDVRHERFLPLGAGFLAGGFFGDGFFAAVEPPSPNAAA